MDRNLIHRRRDTITVCMYTQRFDRVEAEQFLICAKHVEKYGTHKHSILFVYRIQRFHSQILNDRSNHDSGNIRVLIRVLNKTRHTQTYAHISWPG